MYGTQERHAKIRKDVCDYMRSQRERFKWLVEDFEEYVRARERPVYKGEGEWGDHAEIIVMEELFDRPIEIYAPSDGPYKPRKTHMSGELPDQLKHVTPIRLHYQGNNHYNSITVERGKDDTAITSHLKGAPIKLITKEDNQLIEIGDDFGFDGDLF